MPMSGWPIFTKIKSFKDLLRLAVECEEEEDEVVADVENITTPLVYSGPSTSPTRPKAAGVSKQRKYRKEKSKSDRKRKRSAEKAKRAFGEYEVRLSIRKTHIFKAMPLLRQLDTKGVEVVKSGYMGLKSSHHERREYDLDELVGPRSRFKFAYQGWDGKSSRPVVSKSGSRVMAALVGRPKDETDDSWKEVSDEAASVIENARGKCRFSDAQKSHRRADSPSLAVGTSNGGGQPFPKYLAHNAINLAVLLSLLSNWAIQRLAGHANASFAAWAPKLHAYYGGYMKRLYDRLPDLPKNFVNSVWASCTFNFGPRTVTFWHKDSANLAFGWCAITALGKFNPKKSGHLILWDLKLVIEFPPGSTIHIPSAIIAHSNVKLHKGETRYSFTQYTAAGIFRWIDQGFRTAEKFEQEDPKGKKKFDLKASKRWKTGLNLFSTLQELRRM